MERKNSKDIRPKSSLETLLENNHRGFAYEMLELQMSIEDDCASVSGSKIQDITRLIQLYMQGVEALEGAQDQRFRFFSRKLQTIMLKKPVADQLRYAQSSNSPSKIPINRVEKQQEHEIHLMYNKDMSQKERVKELLLNVQAKLRSYEGIVHRQIKRQQDQIRQRIQLRKLKSDSGSVKKFNPATGDQIRSPPRPFQFFDEALIDKKFQAVRQKNLVATSRHDGI